MKNIVNNLIYRGSFFRKAYFAFLAVGIIFSGWSCENEKIKEVEIKLSEDICTLCSSNPTHTMGDNIVTTSQVVTPNGDARNDFFGIWITPDEEYFVISDFSIIFYDRNNKQIVTISQISQHDDLWHIWDGKVNEKFVESGLYSYKLTINGKKMEGKFIIINGSDNYIDVCFYDTECGKSCLEIEPDPVFFEGSCVMPDKAYKLSDDICTLCSQNPTHTIDEEISFVSTQIVTPNGDGINDYFRILGDNFSLDDYPNSSIKFYDRYEKDVVASFSSFNDWSGWDCRKGKVPVESGLFTYKLTINDVEFSGTFIIVNDFDDYLDVSIEKLECRKDCLQDFLLDPSLSISKK